MPDTKFYTGIFVALFVLATAQVLIEGLHMGTWTALGVILAVSSVKAVMVAAYFMHLRFEPRSLTYLIGLGLLGALALTSAAAYSIT